MHDALSTNFTWLDWTIVAGYLGISLVIGLFVRRFIHSMDGYIGAGRAVGPWLGIATMTGTEMGLITVMYSAEKGFSGGFAAFHIALIAGAVALLVALTGFIVVPLREHGVLTIPEFYQKRFDRRTRFLGGILLATGGILNMGLFLQVGAKFVVGVAGLDPAGLAVPLVMTGLLLLVLCYTVLGGMVSVIITDYLQFVVLAFGLLLVSIAALWRLGWSSLFNTVWELQGPGGFDPLASDSDFGSAYVLWMVVLGLVNCAIWPTAVSRALAMESPTAVRRQYLGASLSFMIRFLIPYFWGIAALTYIYQSASLAELFLPAEGAPQVEGLMAMPVFLGQLLPTGVLGLVAAAMIAAFMSTHDSYLLCWSSVLTQDVVAVIRPRMSEAARILMTRVFIVLIGIFVWAWGLFYRGSDHIWDYMAVTGAVYFTGAIPVLIGGLYWKRATAAGATAALICGGSAILALEPIRLDLTIGVLQAVGSGMTREELAAWLTAPRVSLAATALTWFVFITVSLATRPSTPPKVPHREA